MGSCWLNLLLTLSALGPVRGTRTQTGQASRDLQANLTSALLQSIPCNDNQSIFIKLLLDRNQITLSPVDQQALSSYPSVEELQLENNLVTHVPAKYFSVLPKLRVLSLARNSISSLHPQAFSGLELLTQLDLSYNLLTSLPSQLSESFNSLQVLNLNGNPWNCSCPSLQDFEGLKLVCEAAPSHMPAALSRQSQTPPAAAAVRFSHAPRQNHSVSDEEQPAQGNSWKFTAGVAALALLTCLLIVSAIKGPSWFKLLHNYRHQRLSSGPEDGDSESVLKVTQQTFRFKDGRGGAEEEEGYSEDPYIDWTQ